MPTAQKTEVLRAKVFEKLPWLVHGFSTRVGGLSKAYRDGDLNLGFTADDERATVEKNRRLFLREVGAKDWPLVTLKQIHSDRIQRVRSASDKLTPGDGLVTDTAVLLLAIQTADCVPIIIVDPEHGAVGAFHAGWRGTLARIAEKGVGAMRREFGSKPKSLRAALGPAIRACCYTVGEEVRDEFQSQFSYAAELFSESYGANPVQKKYPLMFMNQRAPGHGLEGPELRLDLIAANHRQLLDAGLSAENIEASPLCASCRTDLLFSHRAEKGKTGRMMSVIGISK